MIPIFYRNYPYAPVATLVSGFSYIIGFISAIGAILCILQVGKSPVYILPTIILAGLAAFLFLYVGRKLVDQMAEKETEKNIRTKPRFAQSYCIAHPEEFERIAEINPEFGQKYEINEKGKCVKKK